MASVLVNGPTPTPALTRGKPVNLGTLTAAASVVQFSVAQENATPNGLDCMVIATTGGTITPGLEASIDGGNSWFGVLPRAATGTAPNFSLTTLNADTAATSANIYEVTSLQGGALFRFGSTAITGTPVVWALLS
jgi:hypothetical protein